MRIENASQFLPPLLEQDGRSFSGNALNVSESISQSQQEISEKELQEVVKKGNDILKGSNTQLKFSIHEQTHQILVKLIDTDTNEVIKEIPPEKMVNLVYNLCEQMGIFVDKKLG